MKKTLFIALTLAVICILPSCGKDPAQTKIVFGDSNGMSVISYEGIPLVEQYGHHSWGFYIDLNGDGHHDVQFHSTSETAEGGILTELYCQENTALLGEIIDHNFSLLANNANDSFCHDDTFKSTNVILHKNDCDHFPMNEAKYIGFKLTEDGKSRLGWMRVIHHHDHVELLETAIQK